MGSAFGVLAGMGLLGLLVMVVVGIAVGALLLTLSFRLVVGYMPSYLKAMAAVVLTFIAAAVTVAVLHMVTGSGRLLGMVVQFLVGAAMVNWLLVAGNGLRIGYGKACLVQLVYTVMEIVVGVIIGILLVVVFGAALGAMAHH
jgi:hypothetical protein